MEVDKILKFGQRFGDVTICLTKSNQTTVSFTNKDVGNAINGDSVFLEIRISKGKRFGYSTTNDLTKWKDVVLKAAKIMKLSKDLDLDIPLVQKKKVKPVEGLYYKKVEKLSVEDLFSFAKSLVSAPEKLNVPKAEVSKECEETLFANSNGVFLKEKQTTFSSFVEVSDGNINAVDYHATNGLHDVDKVLKSAVNLCLEKRNPKKISNFKGDVVFDYFAIKDLLETVLIPAVSADEVQAKRSKLFGMLGKKVFSENLTIYDNGRLKNGLFSSSFDGEGVPTRKTIIVENGVLKSFIYDLFSAAKDGVESTGNSNGINRLPNITPTNFVVKKGDFSKDELISCIKKGIYAREIFGDHLINRTTGDCSVGVEDVFYIENGEIKYPIKQAMVNFNLFDALKYVSKIGKVIRQESNVSAPPMVFEGVQVIG